MAIAITATVDAANARVFVQVTGASGTSGEILRVDAAGTATPIRNADPAQWVSGAWADYDYESPLDAPVSYIATPTTDFTDVRAQSNTVTVPSNGKVWLKDPGQPSLNMIIQPGNGGIPSQSYDIPQGVFNVIGARRPVVVTSARFDATEELTVGTFSSAERQALLNILSSGNTLLLQGPAGWDIGSQYVAIGQATVARVDNAPAYIPDRIFTLPITIVDRPVGVAAAGAGNTWGDAVNTYATWKDLLKAKSTWGALIQRVA